MNKLDIFLKYLGIALIGIGGLGVVVGGTGTLIYAVIANVGAVHIVFPVLIVSYLICVSGLLPLLLRLVILTPLL